MHAGVCVHVTGGPSHTMAPRYNTHNTEQTPGPGNATPTPSPTLTPTLTPTYRCTAAHMHTWDEHAALATVMHLTHSSIAS